VGPISQEYQLVPIDDLTPHPANPRRGNLAVIGESIQANGFYGAVIAQRSSGHVLAGNHRLLALRAEGAVTAPVIWLDVDDEQAMRILLVDNRTNDIAGYDNNALARILSDLPSLTGTGYDSAELDKLLAQVMPPEAPAEFQSYDQDLETAYECPKCHYEWSGKPKGQ